MCNRILYIKASVKKMVFLFLTLVLFISCHKTEEYSQEIQTPFTSFHDIPGVTPDEVNAIEKLMLRYDSFTYGMPLSTEAFINNDGEIGGFSALFIEWMAQLFHTPFNIVICEWSDIPNAFETGAIHFNGSMVPVEERRDVYFQTDAIAQRSINYFRLGTSRSVADLLKEERPVKIGLLENTVSAELVISSLEPGAFEAVMVAANTDVYGLLKAGGIDAYAHSNTTEIVFEYDDIITEVFYPLTFTPVSLTAFDPELEPIITVMQKALQHDVTRQYLTYLYNKGYDDYRRHKFYTQLTDEELTYLQQNKMVKTVMQSDNYPLSFYDSYLNEWQGITFDILSEVEALTGLTFMEMNTTLTTGPEMLEMLESGQVSLISGLIRTPEREGRFLWPENANMTNNYALISKTDFRDIKINEVFGVRVGLLENSAHTEMFKRWFPFHTNNAEYGTLNDLMNALDSGEIDMVMQSESWLLVLTNYRERPDFKANIVFASPFASSFGFNIEEEILCSIMDKALDHIDTVEIARRWMSKTYDYRAKMSEEQRPLLIGLSALLLIVVVLLSVLFALNRNAHKRTMLILNATPLACRLWNNKMQLFECNDEVLRLFNLKSKQEYFERYHDLYPEYQPDGRVSSELINTVLQTALNEGRYVFEFMHNTLDGTPLPCEITLVRLRYQNNYVVAGYTRDLREYKKMIKSIRDANDAKSGFLANMSHEMRTPLNVIIGLSNVTLEAGVLDDDASMNLEKINSAGQTLLSIVNDILDISKIEAGKLELIPVEYDTPSLLNDTVTQSILLMEEKPIRFNLNINDRLPAKLYGDELRIKQVINNLLSNAFKYTQKGLVELGIQCEPPESETVWVTVYISDTGMGISPENIDKLFENYAQLDTKTNRKIMGTGLGLPLTKKLVEMMNGTVIVESEYGKGSTFTVRFAQKYISNEVIGVEVVNNLKNSRYIDQKRKQNAKIKRIKIRNAHVLVVDDVVTNLDVAYGLMRPYGMHVDLVSGGQEAIDAIRSEKVKYLAVFMDHMMPEMDGIEATRIIREEIGTEYAKTIPIIALTANAIIGNEEYFLSNGFQAFLPKPIELKRLDEVIREWVYPRAETIDAGDELKFPSWVSLSSIKGINLKKGLERFGYDEESFLSVLRSYAISTTLLLDKINEVNDKNLADYSITVHGIKGSSRGICADGIGDKAEALEMASKNREWAFVVNNNADFINETKSLLTELDEMLRKVAADNIKPKKEKPDKQWLTRLMESCEKYDMDRVDEVLRQLEQYEYENDGDLVTWLWENVHAFNIEEIIARLRDYLK